MATTGIIATVTHTHTVLYNGGGQTRSPHMVYNHSHHAIGSVVYRPAKGEEGEHAQRLPRIQLSWNRLSRAKEELQKTKGRMGKTIAELLLALSLSLTKPTEAKKAEREEMVKGATVSIRSETTSVHNSLLDSALHILGMCEIEMLHLA